MRELRGNWRDIFKGFSVALDLKKLLLGFLGLALTFIIGIAGPFLLASLKNHDLYADFINRDYDCLCTLYWSAWQVILGFPWWQLLLTIVILFLLLLSVWSYFGGAICRIAAINVTKDEGLETSKALSFTTKKFLSFFSPVVISILGFLFFFFWNFLGGLVGRIPYVGELLVTIFLPFAILSGFIMMFIVVGFVFGKGFFYPTIAVEGSDSFDALSRSFSYLYARPWHYIWYQLVAGAYGVATTAFVWLFGYLMIVAALWAGAVGMGGKFTAITNSLGIGGHFGALNNVLGSIGINIPWHWLPPAAPGATNVVTPVASFILAVWLVLTVGFIIAYVISYYFSSQTIIYLLMRKKVDEIDMTEVWTEEEETITTPEIPATPETKPEATGTDKPEATGTDKPEATGTDKPEEKK